RIHAARPNTFCVFVSSRGEGTVLEGLRLRADQTPTAGVSVEWVAVPFGARPVIIRDCTISGCAFGIQVSGVDMTSHRAAPSRGVMVYGNQIHGADVGILVRGVINHCQIVANRVWDCSSCDIRLGDLFEGSGQILIANNTLMDPRRCLEIVEPPKDFREVEIRNNLVLASDAPDMAAIGTDQALAAVWRIDHNW